MNTCPHMLLGLFLTTCVFAETREWKSSDAEKSFNGDYVSHDGENVTIKRDDGKIFIMQMAALHQTNRDWLATKPVQGAPAAPADPPPNAVFDTLCFGDSRKEVESKLLASKAVKNNIEETFFGRIGLNGTFETTNKIGGLSCALYFDWTPSSNLKEVSLRSQPLPDAAYGDRLHTNWESLAELLTTLHGRPLQAGGYPKISDLENDLFLASHIWRLESGGTAMLGSSMQAGKYMVMVRFTTESIKPARTR